MPIEDDIRALKRELAGTGARNDAARRSAILAQLAARGEGPAKTETRGTKKAPAKPAPAASDE